MSGGPVSGGYEVDARGLRCPAPVLRAAVAARALPPGAVLRVLATDPAASVDLPAWARMRGHTVTANERSDDVVVVTVRLGG
ncbi:sulfurtransferase TusA family protein [Cellulomonas shaoxiangyii]|uniref:sulfurtransferase TusA family protein n=1 Tax=Cellulomonas shaoxiangyii TaxID=2566013 RepID=UPI001FB5EC3E|nr:sulfurtransferase TusA family protein [Cellulomonas shaoxiangyii]